MEKIVCIGKNYAEHVKELGDKPSPPVLFLKTTSIIKKCPRLGSTVSATLPKDRGEVHYECEILIRLKNDAFEVSSKVAQKLIADFSLGLDMTLRDLQKQLKAQGHPWTISKVFRDSAIVGPWIKYAKWKDYEHLPFELLMNGQVKQKGQVSEMLMGIPEMISYASYFFPLKKGDLLFTGTPSGVGPVRPRDRAELRWGSFKYFVTWK